MNPEELADIEAHVLSILDPNEEIVAVLPGDGAAIIATTRKVMIVRDRAAKRPRTGLRSWDYWSIREITVQQPRYGQGRIALRTGRYPWQAVSVFFGIRHGAAAAMLVEQIRLRISQNRRG